MISRVIVLSACLFASSALAEAPVAPFVKLDLKDGDSIVFLGDSITRQSLYTQYVEDYFYTRFPKVRLKFHNSGVGGDKAADALARFDRDVAAYKPKYVTVLLGMNDGAVKAFDEPTFATYRTDMTTLVERIKAIGATPILVTPTMFDAHAAILKGTHTEPGRREFYNGVLALYGAWCREQAVEQGLGFVDMYSPLNNLTLAARKKDPSFTMIPDSVHPGPAGQLVMAAAMLSDLGLPTRVSTIDLWRNSKDAANVKVAGGTVTDARFTDDGVEFTMLADSLPLVVPAEANEGVELTKLGHRMSREAVSVNGLEPGMYELFVEDALVGKYTDRQLTNTIELQSNAKTPQYQQALAVATLNAQRNKESIEPLRNLWRTRKLLLRTKAALAEKPDDAAQKVEAAKFEAMLSDFEGQIAKFEAAARKVEDKIFATNQPKSLRYRLVKVKAS
jgi:lysophospholipase L1-like esterase